MPTATDRIVRATGRLESAVRLDPAVHQVEQVTTTLAAVRVASPLLRVVGGIDGDLAFAVLVAFAVKRAVDPHVVAAAGDVELRAALGGGFFERVQQLVAAGLVTERPYTIVGRGVMNFDQITPAGYELLHQAKPADSHRKFFRETAKLNWEHLSANAKGDSIP